MKKLFEIMDRELKAGKDITMVSVTATSGSTPRGAGARMIVGKEGRLYGTIGGGAVEYTCQHKAAEVLENKKSYNHSYMLRKNEIQDLGMICGGDVSCHFQYISPEDQQVREAIDYALELFDKGVDIWIITDVTDGSESGLAVYSREEGVRGMDVDEEFLAGLTDEAVKVQIDGKTICAEQINSSQTVYIFGGGHVAQELVPALSRVKFNCVVIEDREEFARRELFEGVFDTKLIDMNDLETVCKDITANDYVCVMTRGHANDFEVEKNVLKTDVGYIGVIGSRRKIAGVNERLRAEGFTDEDISRITTPIGLDIKAETPAEIAVSITAQMILERAERNEHKEGRN